MTDSADHPLTRALALTPEGETLTAELSGEFSNGPVGAPPEAGFPFGGLLAALCAGAMRQALGITGPLRTLSVQYLAAAKYGQALTMRPRLLRGGRSSVGMRSSTPLTAALVLSLLRPATPLIKTSTTAEQAGPHAPGRGASPRRAARAPPPSCSRGRTPGTRTPARAAWPPSDPVSQTHALAGARGNARQEQQRQQQQQQQGQQT